MSETFNLIGTKKVEWCYYCPDGNVETSVGAYLVCDNGYLRWPTTICPFLHIQKTTLEGYFSSNLESVRKDVECVFGILKKCWKILDYEFRFRNMEMCANIFVTCCCLHNEMLDMMVRDLNPPRVGRGMPIGTDGIWIGSPNDLMCVDAELTNLELALNWQERKLLLANHLKVWKSKGSIV